MKVFDQVKKILENDEQSRNSDKHLQWQVLRLQGKIREIDWFGSTMEVITKDTFLSANTISLETIRRTRQKCQELYPELQATSQTVRVKRKQKQDTKGTWIYRELFQ